MRICIIVLFVFAGTQIFAQYPKLVVQFKDKHSSPYSLSNPSAYLSQKAINRRAIQHIAVDSTDLPVNPSYIQQVLALGNVTYLDQVKWLNRILIQCTDDATINAINQLPFVQQVNPVGFLKTQEPKKKISRETITELASASFTKTATEDTLQYGNAYNQVHIHNGEYLHNKGFTGKGVTIAVLDGGFYHYKELSAFDSARLQNRILGEKDFVDFDNSVDEDNAHGMYCLSTIAANIPGTMVGTAPHASFWLMRTENVFTELPVEEFNWVAAAAYADSAGADMISSSLGYYIFDDPGFNYSYNNFYNNSATVSKGAAIAAAKGMIVTNSAGNEGNNAWKYIIFPADTDSICTVGAVDDNGAIASFSSLGYPGKLKPNIVSIGSGTVIFGTDNTPANGSGTSFSNPNINGLIACLWQAFPMYSSQTILNAVYESADRYINPDNRYGYGIPDMKRAYILLKQKLNNELYGTNWLFANPAVFIDTIHIKLIAQYEGNSMLSLLDKDGTVLQTLAFATEEQEVYDTLFTGLAALPAGSYSVAYTANNITKTAAVTKQGPVMQDWLAVFPVPFSAQLSVYFKAPETGSVHIRLVDASGKTLQVKMVDALQGNYYNILFQSLGHLAKGVYFVQYIASENKTIKVLK